MTASRPAFWRGVAAILALAGIPSAIMVARAQSVDERVASPRQGAIRVVRPVTPRTPVKAETRPTAPAARVPTRPLEVSSRVGNRVVSRLETRLRTRLDDAENVTPQPAVNLREGDTPND